MKTNCWSSLAASCLMVSGALSFAAESVSDIFVGSATVIRGATDTGPRVTQFSLRSLSPVAYQGTITARGQNYIQDTNAPWAENGYNGANGAYYVEFDSGVVADIVDTISASKLLAVAGQLPASVTVGIRFWIRKHRTLAEIFGPANETGLRPGQSFYEADEVILHDPRTQETLSYFYSAEPGFTGWWSASFLPAGDTVVYPEQGLMVRRKVLGDLQVLEDGAPRAASMLTPIFTRYNLVGTLSTRRTYTLAELNLYTGSELTGVASGENAEAADNVIIINADGTTTTLFYLKLGTFEGWYDFALTTPSDNTPIPPGSVFGIQRKAPRGLFYWAVPAE